jgi:hypothetical protein
MFSGVDVVRGGRRGESRARRTLPERSIACGLSNASAKPRCLGKRRSEGGGGTPTNARLGEGPCVGLQGVLEAFAEMQRSGIGVQ